MCLQPCRQWRSDLFSEHLSARRFSEHLFEIGLYSESDFDLAFAGLEIARVCRPPVLQHPDWTIAFVPPDQKWQEGWFAAP